MRTQRLVVAAFLALVLGATGGLLADDAKVIVASEPASLPAETVIEPASRTEIRDTTFVEREIGCLANILFREARSESVGIRRLTAIVTIARRDDPDPQWPKTICGIMSQRGQISQVNKTIDLDPNGLRVLAQDREIAAEVYDGAWKTQKLPRGWECVRYWRISDDVLATLDKKHFEQLGIKKDFKGLSFFDKLVPVKTPPGKVTFYRDPKRCGKALPTT